MNFIKFNIYKALSIFLLLTLISIIIIELYFINSPNIIIENKIPKSKIRKLNRILDNEIHSEKWVVITTINGPNESIKKLTEFPEPWKIVIIGDKKTKDEEWDIYSNSNKLIFLSVDSQLKLNYKTTKYIPYNSYTRKNIGYLYAIEHGAKEIYETDDDNIFNTFDELYQNFDNYTKISYFENNINNMINPYAFFGRPSIWPRGFRLNDIHLDHEKKFFITNADLISSKPLVFQGLANGDPDVDAIFRLTRANADYPIDIDFYDMHPLLYFPGNYIPINSQNTKYLYNSFPAMALPTTVAFRVCDIWRGFILERFIWGYNGTVVFHKPSVYQKRNVHDYYEDFLNEEALYYDLENMIIGLNSDMDIDNDNPGKVVIKIIEILIKNKVLKENDFNMYKSFIEDLESFGYKYEPNYSVKVNNNYKDFLNIESELKFYLPRKQRELMGNNGKEETNKILYHYPTKTIYNDILLIINFSDNNIETLKDYMYSIYSKNFPNIIYISSLEKNNIISDVIYCPEIKDDPSLSYICINRVYKRFSNMKGYLYLNFEVLLKIWELDYLDFEIPWLCGFNLTQNINQNFINLFNINNNYKINLEKFFGKKDTIGIGMGKFFYIPKNNIEIILSIFEEFYKNKIPDDYTICNSFGAALFPKYQYIYYEGWKELNSQNLMNFVRRNNEQIIVYPIDYNSKEIREQIDDYYYFMKAEEF